ncbi:hypothetical protein PVAP13_2KG294200 [Panicum virgatum]|uniref:Uncharacterized protein n=1 Tax=Panicum virgatum TaxID=38727 RepID=A0A8T0W6G2_PANVG|nr:hypothetical protein PVAP13_2KG294200 [Panicum virgatum]
MVFGRSKSSSSTTPSAPSKAAAACSELRAAYHECFNRWYADKFAKGQWQRDDCADHWHKYRSCLELFLDAIVLQWGDATGLCWASLLKGLRNPHCCCSLDSDSSLRLWILW